MKLSTGEKIKFIVLIIILFLVNALFNWPYLNKLKEIKKSLEQEADSLQQSFNLQQNPQQTLTQYQQLKRGLITFDKAFLQQGEELNLIKNLENLSKKHQLLQKMDLNQTPQEVSDLVYKLDLRLTVTGSYLNILKYLDELNQYNYQLTIKYLNIKGLEENLEATLLASSYWLYDQSEKN